MPAERPPGTRARRRPGRWVPSAHAASPARETAECGLCCRPLAAGRGVRAQRSWPGPETPPRSSPLTTDGRGAEPGEGTPWGATSEAHVIPTPLFKREDPEWSSEMGSPEWARPGFCPSGGQFNQSVPGRSWPGWGEPGLPPIRAAEKAPAVTRAVGPNPRNGGVGLGPEQDCLKPRGTAGSAAWSPAGQSCPQLGAPGPLTPGNVLGRHSRQVYIGRATICTPSSAHPPSNVGTN